MVDPWVENRVSSTRILQRMSEEDENQTQNWKIILVKARIKKLSFFYEFWIVFADGYTRPTHRHEK